MLPFVKQSHVVLSPTFLWGAHHAHAMHMPSRARAMAYITLDVFACECCLLLSRADREKSVYV